MLNVGKIEEGFVLDHIKAGKSLSIYHHYSLTNWTAPWQSSKTHAAAKRAEKIY